MCAYKLLKWWILCYVYFPTIKKFDRYRSWNLGMSVLLQRCVWTHVSWLPFILKSLLKCGKLCSNSLYKHIFGKSERKAWSPSPSSSWFKFSFWRRVGPPVQASSMHLCKYLSIYFHEAQYQYALCIQKGICMLWKHISRWYVNFYKDHL